jgi:hypothetical protein
MRWAAKKEVLEVKLARASGLTLDEVLLSRSLPCPRHVIAARTHSLSLIWLVALVPKPDGNQAGGDRGRQDGEIAHIAFGHQHRAAARFDPLRLD